MPRKKTQVATKDVTETTDKKAIAKAAKDTEKLNQRLAIIDEKFGDGLPYDPQRIATETLFYLNQSADAMLEAGKRLILLKEHEPHGEFQNALESIGVAAPTARRLMQAAVKYSDPKRAALIVLGKTKMIELMVEDDEALDELADGGTIAGLDLDDIDKMSSRELKTELHKARDKNNQDAEVHEKLLTSKNKKIDKLHAQVHANKSASWDERVKDFQIETTTIVASMLESLDRLDMLRDVFLNDDFGEENEAANSAMGIVYYDAIRQLIGRAAQVAEACEETFSGYADEAMPMLDYYAEKMADKK